MKKEKKLTTEEKYEDIIAKLLIKMYDQDVTIRNMNIIALVLSVMLIISLLL